LPLRVNGEQVGVREKRHAQRVCGEVAGNDVIDDLVVKKSIEKKVEHQHKVIAVWRRSHLISLDCLD